MSVIYVLTFSSILISLGSFLLETFISPPGLEVPLIASGIFFAVLFICFSAIAIKHKLKAKINDYALFAIMCILIGVVCLAYGLYSSAHSKYGLDGLFGVILMLFVEPAVIILLLMDLAAYLIQRRKK